MHLSIAALTAATAAGSCWMAHASMNTDQPAEFGSVKWGRQLEPALQAAASSEKPVMLLFQEVPG